MLHSLRWLNLGTLSLLLAAPIAFVGCGSDDGDDTTPTPNPCASVPDKCDTAGETQCNDSNTSVLVCQNNADGCLVWTTDRSCGSHATCVDGVCECSNTCETAGQRRCNEDVLEDCTTDAVGCLTWTTNTDCGATNQTCEESSTGAQCVGTCESDCDTAGDLRCNGDLLQTCTDDGNDCLRWETTTDCTSNDQVCDDSGTEPVCTDPSCTDNCPSDGDTQCSGDVVQTCSTGTSGCLEWQDTTDCSQNTPAQTCAVSGGVAACSDECSDNCPAENDLQCSGDEIQTCTMGTDGCLDWETTTDCSQNTPAQTCNASSGTPVCSDTCSDNCPTENDLQCSGDEIQTCTMGTNGCLDWETTTDCSQNTPAQTCSDSGGTPVCSDTCTDNCPAENDVQCSGDEIQTCTVGTNGCLDWETTTDCSQNTPAQTCSDSGGTPVCADTCTDNCPAANDTQCSGDTIETCTLGSNGCLDWVMTTDCSTNTPAQTCNASSGTAVCADTCTDNCPAANDTQCSGDTIETCTLGSNGCLDWVMTTDCTTNTPPGTCDDSGGTAVCQSGTAGDTCSNPQVLTSLPMQVANTDFTADYADDHDFSSGSTCGTAHGAEVIYQIDLTSGQSIRLVEFTGFDAVIRVMSTCDDSAPECLVSNDTDEDFIFTAPAAGTYFIVLEAYYASPSTVQYDFRIEEVPPEDCSNGSDDDWDGDIDCADDECFGAVGACETEVGYCDDGLNNDNEGGADCLDPDCATDPACLTGLGVYESFSSSNPLDVVGCTLDYTVNTSNPNGYDVSGTCACAPAWAYTPGTGTATTTLTLGDSTAEEYAFTQMTGGVSFYGNTYTSLFVGSDGFVTFGSGDTYSNSSDSSFFEYPRIAGLDDDLDPGEGGTVTVDEWTDRVVVTFDGVPFYAYSGTTDTVSFQIVIEASGDVSVVYLNIDRIDDGYAGVCNGITNTPLATETNLVDNTPSPTGSGQLVITEIHYNDDATTTEGDGEFIEIYNATTADLGLGCCTLSDTTGTFDIPATTIIPAAGYTVFVNNADSAANGGISGGVEYTSILLSNSTSENITITCGGNVIDTVPLGGGSWPAGGNGISMQLNASTLDATSNDLTNLWCDSTQSYGDGDLGTPGAANEECVATPLASFDFEADPSWTVAGDWEWGTPTAANGPTACAGGTSCYGTVMDGEYSISTALSDNYVESPAFDLSTVALAELNFDLWLHTEASWDEGRVQVSTDGGTTWSLLGMTSPAYNDESTDWSGDLGDWVPALADLSTYAGQGDVRFRWALYSDGSNTDAGYYIDNVQVSGL